MLLPSWKFPDGRRRPNRGHAGTHRETIVIDDRSGPAWELHESDADVTVSDVEDAAEVELLDFEEAVGLTPDPLPEPDVADHEVIDLSALEQSTVDRTDLLPMADEEPASSTLASLLGFSERQVTYDEALMDEPVEGPWDTLPTLADVALEEDSSNTGTAIQRLWDATEEHSIVTTPLDEPADAPHQRLIDSRRVRRSAIVALVGAVVLVGWAVRTVSDQPERAATAREAAYRDAGAEIATAVDPVGASVELITREDIAASDFSDLTAALDQLDGVARRSAGIAAEPLPRSLPVGSSLALDSLVLPQSLLEQASAQARALEERMGDAITYRLIFANAFDLPPLPVEASLLEIGELGADLSVAIAQSEQVLGDLPADTFFGAHRQQAFDRLARITELQVPYFEALRAGDTAEATGVRDEIRGLIEASRSDLANPLRTTADWANAQVSQLGQVLAELAERTSVD